MLKNVQLHDAGMYRCHGIGKNVFSAQAELQVLGIKKLHHCSSCFCFLVAFFLKPMDKISRNRDGTLYNALFNIHKNTMEETKLTVP